MLKVIIPKEMTQDDLVVIPRREYEQLLSLRQEITEDDVLRWSQEAKQMKQKGVLPVLSSLRDLR